MTSGTVDLNADLGEGGPSDDDLLRVVSSASVACAYHAGDPSTMVATAAKASRMGVTVGAHPSYADREGFGRRPVDVPEDRLFAEIVYQVGAMGAAARAAGSRLRFVKPHGSLYSAAVTDAAVAAPVVRAVAALGLALLCPDGSQMHRLASQAGLRCYREVFADRAYLPDGTLAPRGTPGSVIEDPHGVARRAVQMVLEGRIVAIDGSEIRVGVDSICIHGDQPGAAGLARAVRSGLEAAGVAIAPFVASV